MKIGAAGFIVPFMFAYEPALLMIGDWGTIIWRFFASFIGIILLAAGLHGYFLRPATVWERAILIAAALSLVKPDWVSDIVGFGLLIVVGAAQFVTRGRSAAPAVSTPALER